MAHLRMYNEDLTVPGLIKAMYKTAEDLGLDHGKRDNRHKFDSVSATFEVLRHYCQFFDKYLNNPELQNTPQNAIFLMEFNFHARFDTVPNRYSVKDYHPETTDMDLSQTPEGLEITFMDRSDDVPVNASGKRPHNAVSVELPDPDLHAVLFSSGIQGQGIQGQSIQAPFVPPLMYLLDDERRDETP
ncbi:hypothetical protein C8Q74DRAFT_1367154 [Fomes fomentarius]|nr:hypothetical protein C8Q74DRAFT_1367154 [Fomes fomentarius]